MKQKIILLLLFIISLSSAGFGQASMQPDANTIYRDEQGKQITIEEFGKYIVQQDKYTATPRLDNGRIKSLQVKKVDKDTASQMMVGSAAKEFKGILLDGKPISLSQLKGKIVVLNFWFTACHPCGVEIPELNTLTDKYKNDADVVFLAITFDSKDEVKKFLARKTYKYRQITNAQAICDAYGLSSYPRQMVIDKEGKVYFQQTGYMPGVAQELDGVIQDVKNGKAPTAANNAPPAGVETFDANTTIEDESGKKLDMFTAADMVNSGNYEPTKIQRDGKEVVVLKKK